MSVEATSAATLSVCGEPNQRRISSGRPGSRYDPIAERGGTRIGCPAMRPSMTGSWSVTGRSSSGTKAIFGASAADRAREDAPKNAPASKVNVLREQISMRYEPSTPNLTFRRMSSADLRDAFAIFSELVLRDDYFLDSRGA